MVLRRCNPPSDDIYLTEDGHERSYSVTSSPVKPEATNRRVGAVDESPATAAFNRLQNNVANGFSSTFEEEFAQSDEVGMNDESTRRDED